MARDAEHAHWGYYGDCQHSESRGADSSSSLCQPHSFPYWFSAHSKCGYCRSLLHQSQMMIWSKSICCSQWGQDQLVVINLKRSLMRLVPEILFVHETGNRHERINSLQYFMIGSLAIAAPLGPYTERHRRNQFFDHYVVMAYNVRSALMSNLKCIFCLKFGKYEFLCTFLVTEYFPSNQILKTV